MVLMVLVAQTVHVSTVWRQHLRSLSRMYNARKKSIAETVWPRITKDVVLAADACWDHTFLPIRLHNLPFEK